MLKSIRFNKLRDWSKITKNADEQKLKKVDFAIDKNNYLFICDADRLCVTSLNSLIDEEGQVKAINDVNSRSSFIL